MRCAEERVAFCSSAFRVLDARFAIKRVACVLSTMHMHSNCGNPTRLIGFCYQGSFFALFLRLFPTIFTTG